VRKLHGIALIALAHLACSYVLIFVSFAIGMKSFDSPHILTFSERIWTSVGRIMFLPVAAPLHYLGKDVIKRLMDAPGHSSSVLGFAATIWFFGPLVLNSILWALVIWWACSRVRRRVGGVQAGL
jgi:hypothetical protein